MPRRIRPSPPEVVRLELDAARRDGLDFDAAWDRAWPAFMARINGLKSDARAEWKAAIRSTRGEWAAAYRREETHFSLAVAGRDTLAAAMTDYLLDPWEVVPV